MLWFRGQTMQQKKWQDEKKMQHCMKLLDELNYMYKLVNKLFIVCKRKNLKLILENPYSQEHFLRRYWCLLPSVIDEDRRENGDYFKKPTQYWFYNVEPSNNLLLDVANDNSTNIKDAIKMGAKKSLEEKGICVSTKTARSMIHPEYANRFIRQYVLD